MLLLGAPAAAEPFGQQHVMTAVQPHHEIAAPRRPLDHHPDIASRVFGARVTLPREEIPAAKNDDSPEVELQMSFDLPPKKAKKKWRPKVIPWPMKSLSKGDGSGRLLGIKFRF